ncbi:MAG: fumarate hydratase C-terminal domain-containing protein [Bacillota bacterium]|nr:fumarate hydratase C-terminal domain-containing protein [Bacillota bacterium]
MSDQVLHLELPLNEQGARRLTLGTVVVLSGLVFTGRSRFHIRAVEQGLVPQLDYRQVNAFFHVGPVMRQAARGTWEVVSCEPTSSIRFERYAPEVVRRLGLRTLIGKTTMGKATADALREVGGVHLTKVGLCGNALARSVKRVCSVHFLEELGKTEATWVYEVQDFGPFFVDMDARGNNLFRDLDSEVGLRMAKIYEKLGIPDGYEYTPVSGREGR